MDIRLCSSIHVCSQKEMFNSLVAKEEETVKMVDDSACEIFRTETIIVTSRDKTVRTLKTVQYVPQVRYNLISIWMLDSERCQIQV